MNIESLIFYYFLFGVLLIPIVLGVRFAKRKYTRRTKVERRQEENPFLRSVIEGFKKFLESPFK